MSLFQVSTRVRQFNHDVITNTVDSCNRGKDCWFLHDITSHDTFSNPSTDITEQLSCPSSSSVQRDSATSENNSTYTCGICLERPTTFGIMVNCPHVFCLCLSPFALLSTNMIVCIKKWRDKDGKTEDTILEG